MLKVSKNILILNYEYPPLWWWAWVVSQKYAEWLSNLWNNVTVLTTWFEWEKELFELWNLKIIKLKSLRKRTFQSNPIEMLSWVYHSIKFLNTYLKENKFDVCIAFFSIPWWIVSKYINDKFQIPYIVSTHWADIPWFYPEKMKKFHMLTNWYAKKIWKQADRILVLTNEMKILADNFLKSDKNTILPNWCYSDFFYPDTSKKKWVFTIIFVWRLCVEKDPLTMLKSIKMLKEFSDNFILNIVWDWPLRADMEEYVSKNNLSDNVFFTWWITKNELKNYYQSSHIQICTSKVEAMSIAILESLYSWLYILSTFISWNSEIIKQWINWEFFEIWDYDSLWKKLIYWIDNYEKIEINYNELDKLKKTYSRDNIIYNLNKILHE